MASYDLLQVQRLRIALEDDGFGVDKTGSIADFYDLRIEPTRLMRETVVVEDPTIVQRAFQRRNDVAGPRRGSVAISSLWTASGLPLNAASSPQLTVQNAALWFLLGGVHYDQGSEVEPSPSPTTTSCTVDTGHGSRFSEGTFAAFVIGGTTYPVLITSVAGDALEWWPALPSAPSGEDAVYNSQSVYLADQPSASIQVLMEAANQRGNIWLGLGGQGDFGLELDRGDLAKWTSNIQFAQVLHDDELDTPLGGDPIGAATYDDTGGIVAFRGGVHFGPSASTTRSMVKVDSMSFSLGRSWLEVGQHDGVEGLAPWQLNTRERITVELSLLAENPYEAYHEAFVNQTDYGLMVWLDGGGPGHGRVVAFPSCQIAAPPEPTEVHGGLEGVSLTLLVKENALNSSFATEIQRSPFVIGNY